VRQRRRRNRILTNLLQQLPAVRQMANADLLVQFRGVVVLGAMNYGSRGNHEAVASAVTQVFRDRLKQERRIRRLKEMEKRYHLVDPTLGVPRHSSGGGMHRIPSWSTIDEILPETEVRWAGLCLATAGVCSNLAGACESRVSIVCQPDAHISGYGRADTGLRVAA
jgi:hypothetical protein